MFSHLPIKHDVNPLHPTLPPLLPPLPPNNNLLDLPPNPLPEQLPGAPELPFEDLHEVGGDGGEGEGPGAEG